MQLPSPSSFGAVLSGAAEEKLTYSALKSKYGEFSVPRAEILFGGAPLKCKQGVVGDISVELTSGFEASVARFRIFNLYNQITGKFDYDGVKAQVTLGNSLSVSLGYLNSMELVFVGFVAGLNFGYESGDLPYLEVTGMDVKGVMMSGSYAAQLPAECYSDAVKQVLQKAMYQTLAGSGAVTAVKVSDTPDKRTPAEKSGKASAGSMEMVCESDYEFVVKAAKRCNFEFFTERGTVYFRPAKPNKAPQMELTVGAGLLEFDIGYSITGLVGQVEARAADAGTGKLITAKKKWSNQISGDSKAKALVAKRQRVYLDSTITSKKDAAMRTDALAEKMSYRFGALECTCIGIPDLFPGRFVAIGGLGAPIANRFYVTTVIHSFSDVTGYRTRLLGEAEKISASPPSL